MRELKSCALHPWEMFHAFLVWKLKLQFPSFESMIAPVVRRKVLPRIIGLEVLFSISMIRKSTGKKVICNSTITSLNFPKACLIESSARARSIEHFPRFFNSSTSYNSLDKTETLDPRSNIAWCVSFPIMTSTLGIHNPQD